MPEQASGFEIKQRNSEYDRDSAVVELQGGSLILVDITLNGYGCGSINARTLNARGGLTEQPATLDHETMRAILAEMEYHTHELKHGTELDQIGPGGGDEFWVFTYPLKMQERLNQRKPELYASYVPTEHGRNLVGVVLQELQESGRISHVQADDVLGVMAQTGDWSCNLILNDGTHEALALSTTMIEPAMYVRDTPQPWTLGDSEDDLGICYMAAQGVSPQQVRWCKDGETLTLGRKGDEVELAIMCDDHERYGLRYELDMVPDIRRLFDSAQLLQQIRQAPNAYFFELLNNVHEQVLQQVEEQEVAFLDSQMPKKMAGPVMG